LAGQTSTVSEPIQPLQLSWLENARQQALEGDEVDLHFFNAAMDINSCDIRAFEPVNSALCNDLNWATFSSAGYISIPPFNYQFNVLNNSGTDTLSSIRFDASLLAGEASVLLITGALNPSQNPDGFPLGAYYSTEAGGMLMPCTITTGIEATQQHNGVAVFPNPSSEFIHINRNSKKTTPLFVEIRDVQGRLIHSNGMFDESIQIRISDLANGVYYVRLFDTETSETKPFVIAR
jgi:hypothetical protein